jgi:hypothetical protein
METAHSCTKLEITDREVLCDTPDSTFNRDNAAQTKSSEMDRSEMSQ